MTTEEKIERVQAISEETDEDVIRTFLMIAKEKIIARAYPFHIEEAEMPPRYDNLQCEIAVYMLNKRGAEGETKHNENGTERSYESASVPESMLSAVVPMSRAFGYGELKTKQ